MGQIIDFPHPAELAEHPLIREAVELKVALDEACAAILKMNAALMAGARFDPHAWGALFEAHLRAREQAWTFTEALIKELRAVRGS